MKGEKISKYLFGIIFIFLFIPIIQNTFKIVNLDKLNGVITEYEDIDFTYENWVDEKYQSQKEKYLNQDFGFRKTLVRLQNQISFSLFDYSSTQTVIIGKDNYLFSVSYLDALSGKDFNGEKNILKKVEKIKAVQDTLAKLKKHLVVIFAAGKASYYPEYIPDKYKVKIGKTNNEVYTELCKLNNINYIDFNKWFVNLKKSAKYPLFTKTGTHWSTYGLTIAADSMVKYIEKTLKTDLPELYWNNIIVSDSLRDDDDDIEKSMNLLFKIPNQELAYPTYIYNNINKRKLNSIIVSDSYFMRLYYKDFMKNMFNRGKFWYYNRIIYPESQTKETSVTSVDLNSEVNQTDLFIIMATEANSGSMAWGFIDDMYELYFENTAKTPFEIKVKKYINIINMSKDWLAKIREKAIKQNLPLDSMIYLDAVFMANKEIAKEKKTN